MLQVDYQFIYSRSQNQKCWQHSGTYKVQGTRHTLDCVSLAIPDAGHSLNRNKQCESRLFELRQIIKQIIGNVHIKWYGWMDSSMRMKLALQGVGGPAINLVCKHHWCPVIFQYPGKNHYVCIVIHKCILSMMFRGIFCCLRVSRTAYTETYFQKSLQIILVRAWNTFTLSKILSRVKHAHSSRLEQQLLNMTINTHGTYALTCTWVTNNTPVKSGS